MYTVEFKQYGTKATKEFNSKIQAEKFVHSLRTSSSKQFIRCIDNIGNSIRFDYIVELEDR